MKKILVYTTQYMPTGGIESHLKEFCKQMSKAGFVIDLVVLNSRMLPETISLFKQACNNVYVCKRGRSIWRIIWLILTGMRLSAIRYSAFYSNGQGDSIGLLAKFIRFRTWVHHHHTAGDKADQANWSNEYRKILLLANKIVACSQRNANDIRFAINRSIDVIYCFSQQIDVKELSYETAPGKIRLGYYGRLIPEKGIDILCRLSEEPEFEPVEIQLWGEGISYNANYFERYPRIKYHGRYTGREGLIQAIQSMDGFLLLSSHAEGLPVSLLEAMSAGLPWLATDRGGIADIAVDANATRLLPSSATYEQIKNKVLHFATDLSKNKILKMPLIDIYNKKFSPAVLVSEWIKAFN